jgi:hypothetical protein
MDEGRPSEHSIVAPPADSMGNSPAWIDDLAKRRGLLLGADPRQLEKNPGGRSHPQGEAVRRQYHKREEVRVD